MVIGKCSEVEDNVETEEDYEELAKQLGNASPLEIMDKALEKFGNEIAIAFRYVSKFKSFFFLVINFFGNRFDMRLENIVTRLIFKYLSGVCILNS